METKSIFVTACKQNDVEKVAGFNVASLRDDIVMRGFKSALKHHSDDVVRLIKKEHIAPIYETFNSLIGEANIDHMKVSNIISAYETKMFEAARDGNLYELKDLAKKGLDYQYDKNILLRIASGKGHMPIVEYLVEALNVNIHDCDNGAIKFANHLGQTDVVNYLHKMGSEI